MSIRHSVLIVVACLGLPLFADQVAPHAFGVETRGELVCKIENEEPSLCYKLISTGSKDALPVEVELVAPTRRLRELAPDGDITKLEGHMIKEAAPAYFVRAEDRAYVLETFRDITVRNVGVDLDHVRTLATNNSIPVLATITWHTLDGRGGTMNLQAVANVPRDLDVLNDVQQASEVVANFVVPGLISQTSPIPWRGVDVEPEAEFIRRVIGPAMVGGYLIFPLAVALADGIAHAIESMIDALFGRGVTPTPPAPVAPAPTVSPNAALHRAL